MVEEQEVIIRINNKNVQREVVTNGKFRGSRAHWDRIWKNVLPMGHGGELLDTGCGEHLWEASDWNVSRCDSWQEYHNRNDGEDESIPSDVDPCDLGERWPYDDNQFDCVVAVEVIEHLENIYHFFREAMRVAKSCVIVSTPNTESRFSKLLYYEYGYLWGFIPSEIKGSHHLNPVFEWQMRLVEKTSGWKLDRIAYANQPFRLPPRFRSIKRYAAKQPTRKGRIFRFRKL